MPELPEVETVVRGLRKAGLAGRVVRRVDVRWPKAVSGLSAAAFASALSGRTIRGIERRAKYIVIGLDDGRFLLVHLRMTGQLRFERDAAPDPHDQVVLLLDDGRSLHFHDTRKFGRFRLVDHPDDLLAGLGPEPLGDAFTLAAFRRDLRQHRRMIKPLLLDQTFVAGIGNIYADESLWAARVHPSRRADTLTPAEAAALHAAIRKVLAGAITAEGTTLGHGATNFLSVAGRRGRHAEALQVFRRTGEPCPRCGQPIRRIVVGQRGTHICPRCQTRKPTAGAAAAGGDRS